MEIDFSGKTVLITGAGKGIGRATSKLLAMCGANVVALSRTQSDLDSLKAEIPTKITTVCADLLNLDEAVKAVEATGEHIDLLVNNAAIQIAKATIDVTDEDIDRCVTVNIKAPIRLSQMVARDLIKRGKEGAIVNISGVLSQINTAYCQPYSTTKAALTNITTSLAKELAKYKVRVNSIIAGLVKTAMTDSMPDEALDYLLKRHPRGQQAEPEEIAHTIAYLLSDKASNITGANIVSDGGFLIN